MALTRQEQKKYFNACDPANPLDREDDTRYVPLDEKVGDHDRVRGADWVEEIATVIELSDTPVCSLFTGLPGTGKSTTLRRLMHRLERAESPFFCVFVNMTEHLDMNTPAEVPDILIPIVLEVERAVLCAEGRDADDALRGGYLARLWAWLTAIDPAFLRFEEGARIDPRSSTAGLPAGPSALAALRASPPLRALLHLRIAEHLSVFLADLREEIVRLHDRTMRAPPGGSDPYAGIVVIVDSLERLRGEVNNFEHVLLSAERLFAEDAESLRLVPTRTASSGRGAPLVHTVYTTPAALATRRNIYGLKFLPMIKLRTKTGEQHAPGVAVARRLIRARVPDEVLLRVFGGTPEDMEAKLLRIILWSGGYPREIVRMLRNVIAEGGPVSDARLGQLLKREGDGYCRTVMEIDIPWLARVAVGHALTFSDDSQRPMVDRLFANSVVLRYQNDDEWFDVHPALFDHPAFREQVKKLRDELLERQRADA